jgi:hypothetical protein
MSVRPSIQLTIGAGTDCRYGFTAQPLRLPVSLVVVADQGAEELDHVRLITCSHSLGQKQPKRYRVFLGLGAGCGARGAAAGG